MPLQLQYRWEHALIAATVEAASRSSPGSYLGRTAIQKLLYFLNVLGVPMRYTFDIHHYGPFCSSVMYDVEWLLADGVIEDQSQRNHYSNYRPGSGWTELDQQYDSQLHHYRDVIENVCRAIGDLEPETLELIATLDFSFRWVRARGGDGPWKDAAVQKFKLIKKDRFSDERIDAAYQSLVQADLIEA